MHLHRLELTDFRNFSKYSVGNLIEGVNSIIAPNGSGKSNLLEAIYITATGSSPRTKRTKEAVRWGAKLGRVVMFSDQDELGVRINEQGRKLYRFNEEINLREMMSRISVVMFQPQDLNLISGAPSLRRKYLDRLLGQISFDYLYELVTYRYHLDQRNRLLRIPAPDLVHLGTLEGQLASRGAKIIQMRAELISRINSRTHDAGISIQYLPSPRIVRELTGNYMREMLTEEQAILSVKGKSTSDSFAGYVRELLREKFSEMRERERQLGFSLIGPQRDDFTVSMSKVGHLAVDIDVGMYGSRGEQRMVIVLFKTIECDLIEEARLTRPILLLDDVLSELDGANRGRMFELVQKQQTFITATDDAIIPARIPHNSRIYLK